MRIEIATSVISNPGIRQRMHRPRHQFYTYSSAREIKTRPGGLGINPDVAFDLLNDGNMSASRDHSNKLRHQLGVVRKHHTSATFIIIPPLVGVTSWKLRLRPPVFLLTSTTSICRTVGHAVTVLIKNIFFKIVGVTEWCKYHASPVPSIARRYNVTLVWTGTANSSFGSKPNAIPQASPGPRLNQFLQHKLDFTFMIIKTRARDPIFLHASFFTSLSLRYFLYI